MKEEKVIGQIYKTKDYDMFTPLPGNRKLNLNHVSRLMLSFQRKYLVVPIIVNNDYMVVDGQHRLAAAKNLRYDVYYIIQDYHLPECHMLNEANEKYKPIDFLEGYISLGYPEYKRFQEFRDKYPFLSLHLCSIFLTGG